MKPQSPVISVLVICLLLAGYSSGFTVSSAREVSIQLALDNFLSVTFSPYGSSSRVRVIKVTTPTLVNQFDCYGSCKASLSAKEGGIYKVTIYEEEDAVTLGILTLSVNNVKQRALYYATIKSGLSGGAIPIDITDTKIISPAQITFDLESVQFPVEATCKVRLINMLGKTLAQADVTSTTPGSLMLYLLEKQKYIISYIWTGCTSACSLKIKPNQAQIVECPVDSFIDRKDNMCTKYDFFTVIDMGKIGSASSFELLSKTKKELTLKLSNQSPLTIYSGSSPISAPTASFSTTVSVQADKLKVLQLISDKPQPFLQIEVLEGDEVEDIFLSAPGLKFLDANREEGQFIIESFRDGNISVFSRQIDFKDVANKDVLLELHTNKGPILATATGTGSSKTVQSSVKEGDILSVKLSNAECSNLKKCTTIVAGTGVHACTSQFYPSGKNRCRKLNLLTQLQKLNPYQINLDGQPTLLSLIANEVISNLPLTFKALKTGLTTTLTYTGKPLSLSQLASDTYSLIVDLQKPISYEVSVNFNSKITLKQTFPVPSTNAQFTITTAIAASLTLMIRPSVAGLAASISRPDGAPLTSIGQTDLHGDFIIRFESIADQKLTVTLYGLYNQCLGEQAKCLFEVYTSSSLKTITLSDFMISPSIQPFLTESNSEIKFSSSANLEKEIFLFGKETTMIVQMVQAPNVECRIDFLDPNTEALVKSEIIGSISVNNRVDRSVPTKIRAVTMDAYPAMGRLSIISDGVTIADFYVTFIPLRYTGSILLPYVTTKEGQQTVQISKKVRSSTIKVLTKAQPLEAKSYQMTLTGISMKFNFKEGLSFIVIDKGVALCEQQCSVQVGVGFQSDVGFGDFGCNANLLLDPKLVCFVGVPPEPIYDSIWEGKLQTGRIIAESSSTSTATLFETNIPEEAKANPFVYVNNNAKVKGTFSDTNQYFYSNILTQQSLFRFGIETVDVTPFLGSLALTIDKVKQKQYLMVVQPGEGTPARGYFIMSAAEMGFYSIFVETQQQVRFSLIDESRSAVPMGERDQIIGKTLSFQLRAKGIYALGLETVKSSCATQQPSCKVGLTIKLPAKLSPCDTNQPEYQLDKDTFRCVTPWKNLPINLIPIEINSGTLQTLVPLTFNGSSCMIAISNSIDLSRKNYKVDVLDSNLKQVAQVALASNILARLGPFIQGSYFLSFLTTDQQFMAPIRISVDDIQYMYVVAPFLTSHDPDKKIIRMGVWAPMDGFYFLKPGPKAGQQFKAPLTKVKSAIIMSDNKNYEMRYLLQGFNILVFNDNQMKCKKNNVCPTLQVDELLSQCGTQIQRSENGYCVRYYMTRLVDKTANIGIELLGNSAQINVGRQIRVSFYLEAEAGDSTVYKLTCHNSRQAETQTFQVSGTQRLARLRVQTSDSKLILNVASSKKTSTIVKLLLLYNNLPIQHLEIACHPSGEESGSNFYIPFSVVKLATAYFSVKQQESMSLFSADGLQLSQKVLKESGRLFYFTQLQPNTYIVMAKARSTDSKYLPIKLLYSSNNSICSEAYTFDPNLGCQKPADLSTVKFKGQNVMNLIAPNNAMTISMQEGQELQVSVVEINEKIFGFNPKLKVELLSTKDSSSVGEGPLTRNKPSFTFPKVSKAGSYRLACINEGTSVQTVPLRLSINSLPISQVYAPFLPTSISSQNWFHFPLTVESKDEYVLSIDRAPSKMSLKMFSFSGESIPFSTNAFAQSQAIGFSLARDTYTLLVVSANPCVNNECSVTIKNTGLTLCPAGFTMNNEHTCLKQEATKIDENSANAIHFNPKLFKSHTEIETGTGSKIGYEIIPSDAAATLSIMTEKTVLIGDPIQTKSGYNELPTINLSGNQQISLNSNDMTPKLVKMSLYMNAAPITSYQQVIHPKNDGRSAYIIVQIPKAGDYIVGTNEPQSISTLSLYDANGNTKPVIVKASGTDTAYAFSIHSPGTYMLRVAGQKINYCLTSCDLIVYLPNEFRKCAGLPESLVCQLPAPPPLAAQAEIDLKTFGQLYTVELGEAQALGIKLNSQIEGVSFFFLLQNIKKADRGSLTLTSKSPIMYFPAVQQSGTYILSGYATFSKPIKSDFLMYISGILTDEVLMVLSPKETYLSSQIIPLQFEAGTAFSITMKPESEGAFAMHLADKNFNTIPSNGQKLASSDTKATKGYFLSESGTRYLVVTRTDQNCAKTSCEIKVQFSENKHKLCESGYSLKMGQVCSTGKSPQLELPSALKLDVNALESLPWLKMSLSPSDSLTFNHERAKPLTVSLLKVQNNKVTSVESKAITKGVPWTVSPKDSGVYYVSVCDSSTLSLEKLAVQVNGVPRYSYLAVVQRCESQRGTSLYYVLPLALPETLLVGLKASPQKISMAIYKNDGTVVRTRLANSDGIELIGASLQASRYILELTQNDPLCLLKCKYELEMSILIQMCNTGDLYYNPQMCAPNAIAAKVPTDHMISVQSADYGCFIPIDLEAKDVLGVEVLNVDPQKPITLTIIDPENINREALVSAEQRTMSFTQIKRRGSYKIKATTLGEPYAVDLKFSVSGAPLFIYNVYPTSETHNDLYLVPVSVPVTGQVTVGGNVKQANQKVEMMVFSKNEPPTTPFKETLIKIPQVYTKKLEAGSYGMSIKRGAQCQEKCVVEVGFSGMKFCDRDFEWEVQTRLCKAWVESKTSANPTLFTSKSFQNMAVFNLEPSDTVDVEIRDIPGGVTLYILNSQGQSMNRMDWTKPEKKSWKLIPSSGRYFFQPRSADKSVKKGVVKYYVNGENKARYMTIFPPFTGNPVFTFPLAVTGNSQSFSKSSKTSFDFTVLINGLPSQASQIKAILELLNSNGDTVYTKNLYTKETRIVAPVIPGVYSLIINKQEPCGSTCVPSLILSQESKLCDPDFEISTESQLCQQPPEVRKPNRWWLIALIVALALIFAAIVGYLIYRYLKSRKTDAIEVQSDNKEFNKIETESSPRTQTDPTTKTIVYDWV